MQEVDHQRDCVFFYGGGDLNLLIISTCGGVGFIVLCLWTPTGKGTIGILREDKQEAIDVSKGDIMVIPAGTTGFLANTDESENLCLFKIFNSVSTSPGKVEVY